MAFANPSYTDVLATTIEARSKVIADNVSKNTALLARLAEKGNIRTVDGGVTILEELSFQANANAQWYSGGDLLNVAAQDVISAASFPWAQAAVAVVINGLEQLQNSGKERMIDLMAGRVKVAESSLRNLVAEGVYSDGTGYGGKQLTGLAAAVPLSYTTGTYGGINRAVFSFWQNQVVAPGAGVITAANINTYMNQLWMKCVRNKDHPDLIVADNSMFALYLAFLQNLQRFTDAKKGKLGFPTLQFIDADVVLDGGIGGFAPASQMFFLNTDFIFYRPHKDRNMVALNPGKRYATNQDAEVQLIGFAGQMTCSGDQFQGRLSNS